MTSQSIIKYYFYLEWQRWGDWSKGKISSAAFTLFDLTHGGDPRIGCCIDSGYIVVMHRKSETDTLSR